MSEVREKLIKAIDQRRSVRKYVDKKVSEEDLEIILESGRQAPSGENAQPWRFLVVRDQKNKEFIAQTGKNGSGRRFTGEFLSKQMHRRFEGLKDPEKRKRVFKKLTSGNVSSFVSQADVVLVVLGKKDVWDLPYDTSAAIENILVTVTELGLGSCWVIAPCIDVRDELKLKEHFNVPDDLKVISVLSIGHPARDPNARPRKPLNELVYKEGYGEKYYK